MRRDFAIYLGNFSVGRMDAQCQLVIGNSLMLRELGYHVIMIDNDPQSEGDSNPFSCKVTTREGLEYYTIPFHKSVQELMGQQQMMALKRILLEIGVERIKYIFCYGSLGYANLLFSISHFCKKHGIILLYNCVDIPDLNHGSTIERIVKKTDRWILHQAISREMQGLIAVSSYIKDYFGRKTNYPIIVIPPLRDTMQIPEVYVSGDDKLHHLVYVGVPFPVDGRQVSESAYKDRIDLFIDLLNEIDDFDYRLDIYGLEKDQYLSVVRRQEETLNRLGEKVVFHGKVNHTEALEVVKKADFTVNYRVKNQMTMAGFSTKFVESVSCGTPPIVTDTSEYTAYCDKGADIIILDPDDHASQIDTMRRCLSLPKDEIRSMKSNCYNSRLFDYRRYIENFSSFLNSVDQQTSP